MSEKLKGELKIMVVGGAAMGSRSGGDRGFVEAMLGRLGVGVIAVQSVYEALGRLSGDGEIGAVIVRLAEVGLADFAFFGAVRRLERGISVYVDASEADREDVERALSMGAVGVIEADEDGASVLADLAGGVNGESSKNGHAPMRFPWDSVAEDDQPVRIGPADDGAGFDNSSESFLADGETDVMLKSGNDDRKVESEIGADVDSTELLLTREEIDQLIYGESDSGASSLDDVEGSSL